MRRITGHQRISEELPSITSEALLGHQRISEELPSITLVMALLGHQRISEEPPSITLVINSLIRMLTMIHISRVFADPAFFAEMIIIAIYENPGCPWYALYWHYKPSPFFHCTKSLINAHKNVHSWKSILFSNLVATIKRRFNKASLQLITPRLLMAWSLYSDRQKEYQ